MARSWLRRPTAAVLTVVAVAIPLLDITYPDATLLPTFLLVAASLVCLPDTTLFGRWFLAMVGAVSSLLMFVYELPMSTLLEGLSSGGPLLVFLLLVEVLGAAIQTGRYAATLTAVLNRFGQSAGARRTVAGLGAFCLTMFGMYAAAIPTVYYALDGRRGEAGLPNAISASRGFTAAVMLSPVSPLVVVAVGAARTNLLAYMAYALPVSLMMLLLDWLPRRGSALASDATQPVTGAVAVAGALPAGRLWRQAGGLALGVAAFVAVCHALGLVGVSNLIQLALGSVGAALMLGLVTGREWLHALARVPADRFVRHAGAVPVFVVGGLLGNVVVASGLLTPLVQFMRTAHLPWLEAPLIILLMIAFRWMGVVPAVALFILVPIFAPAVSLPPALYAAIMVFGTNAAVLISPISVTTLFVAGATEISPFEICFNRQRRYVLATALLVSLYAAVVVSLFRGQAPAM